MLWKLVANTHQAKAAACYKEVKEKISTLLICSTVLLVPIILQFPRTKSLLMVIILNYFDLF